MTNPVFQGVDYGNMDPKGRLAVPARHREHVREQGEVPLVITVHHQERCLVLRPMAVWRELAEHIQKLPNADRVVQSFQRKVLGYAQDLRVDGNGRILMPPALREYARLKKRVAVVGLGERLELWHAPDWDRQIAESLDGLPDSIRGLRL